MNKELRKAIINFIIDNENYFQLTNAVVENFKLYIYDGNGEYLLGGREVYQFIKDAINLMVKQN